MTKQSHAVRSATALAAVALSLAPLARPAAAQADAKPKPAQARPNAQRPAGQDNQGEVTIGSDLVLLDVTVVDKSNHPVFDLGKDRFAISEDGVPQEIKFFNKEIAPVSLALVIDTSGTMRTKLDTVVEAATKLVATDQPDDEVAVVQFKDQIELLEEFTTEERDVEDALGDLVAYGQTALLDAVMLSSDYAQKEGRNRRKAVLVITDGLEKNSYYSYQQVADHLKKNDVRLYLVGLTSDLDQTGSIFKKSPKKNAEALLTKLATDTGGIAFFPPDLSQLPSIATQIGNDLRTSYAIGYYPTNDKKDGTFRKVDVRVNDAKLAARTRAGYYAEKQ